MSSVQVGDTLPFNVSGKMIPFEVIQDMGGLYKIRSLDLLIQTNVTGTFWNEQKRRLTEAGYFKEQSE